MDVIDFVQTKRDRALQVSDYDSYRQSLSRQLLAVRRRLRRTTPKNAKFTAKAPVTAADIANNHESMKLLLIPAERAWAHAMHIKESHAEDNASKGISGATRRHIVSKLQKAATHAETLVKILSDRSTSNASDADYLEVKAYASSLAGAAEFEKQVSRRHEDPQEQKTAWKKCLAYFSEAHVIYSALLFATKKEAYREVISGTIDPSIRYAAYQSKLSRTISTSTVAKRNFPQDDPELLALVKKLNPNALNEAAAQTASKDADASSVPLPSAITWRNRSAPIADAAIGQALAAATLAANRLSSLLTSKSSTASNTRKLAAAYDPVLTAAQDAVDAVHRAITDLVKEGVAESDPRMQDLRVSDLAVNYSLISWRIGRNRVLISGSAQDDGVTFEPENIRPVKVKTPTTENTSNSSKQRTPKPETIPRRLARLTERAVLLESTLQSIESIKYLPGASRDTTFTATLDAQHAYFHAIRCLTIGYSHQLLGQDAEALALFVRASTILSAPDANVSPESVSAAPTSTNGLAGAGVSAPGSGLKTLLVAPESLAHLRSHLAAVILRQRGLVALHGHLSGDRQVQGEGPLIDRLASWPRGGKVDLKNIVTYPPRLEPVPVKPILLDLAWNYIDYPGRVGEDGDIAGGDVAMGGVEDGDADAAKGQPKKKGWFGFGR